MERVFIDGVMVENMLEPIIKTKNKALALIIGLMAEDMKEIGKMVKETALEKWSILTELKNTGFGSMTKDNL
jgi:hypothetical protein